MHWWSDVVLEGLSNITTNTYCQLCGHKKLNKLDDSKKFKSKNYGNKLEIKRVHMEAS